MALNRQVFSQRAVTAVFFVAAMLSGLCWSNWSFLLLVLVIHAGCWVEYEQLYAAFRFPVRYMVLGFFYLSLSWTLFIDLKLHDPLASVMSTSWPVLPLFVLACMWINDTMAYMVGSLIGRTPLSPVSPKKTWEGLGASIVGAIVGGQLLVLLTPASFWFGLLFGAAILMSSVLGDLSESLLKRDLNVKDMGTVLPGHGGVLDRIDSLIPSSFVAFLLSQMVF